MYSSIYSRYMLSKEFKTQKWKSKWRWLHVQNMLKREFRYSECLVTTLGYSNHLLQCCFNVHTTKYFFFFFLSNSKSQSLLIMNCYKSMSVYQIHLAIYRRENFGFFFFEKILKDKSRTTPNV